jgi:hypothetical protein
MKIGEIKEYIGALLAPLAKGPYGSLDHASSLDCQLDSSTTGSSIWKLTV